MSKSMIEQLYDIAVLDFKLSRSEDEKWDARKRMADLEHTSAILYGFAYVDELSLKKNACYTC